MENTKKKYSPAEAAVKVLERVKELYKVSDLYKSNTAHEIESGPEPQTENTECPEQLAEGENIKKAKKKHNESGNEEVDGDVPEHEESLSPEDKELHDSTESESDEEEIDEENDAEAFERDKQDADNTEEGAEAPEEKLGNESEDEEDDKDTEKIVDDVVDSADKEDKKKKKVPFEKSEKLEKSLFPKDKPSSCEVVESTYSKKDSLMDDVRYKIENLMKIRECRWIVEEEFPKQKDFFEKMFQKLKSEIGDTIQKYSKVRKSEFNTEEAETLLAKACVDKACGLKSPKLGGFMKQRAMKKAKVYEIKSKKKVADLPSDNYEPKKVKKPSDKFMLDQKKYKEQIEAGRNPAKDQRDKQYRKKTPKKKVIVDKDRGNKKIRRKKANRQMEKMLGVKDQAREAYKKPEIPKPPKLNEGY